MAMQDALKPTEEPKGQKSMSSRVSIDGIIAGLIGAVTLAVWFLVSDLFDGKPLYTPEILAKILYGPLEGPAREKIQTSFEIVLTYTWVHWLFFTALGGVTSWLLSKAERNPNLGFGVLLLFIIFGFGSAGFAAMFLTRVLHVLHWPTILIGNTLAALAMTGYFWMRHPHMKVNP